MPHDWGVGVTVTGDNEAVNAIRSAASEGESCHCLSKLNRFALNYCTTGVHSLFRFADRGAAAALSPRIGLAAIHAPTPPFYLPPTHSSSWVASHMAQT